MDDFYIIVWLLPILFMIHDFEEIVFFKPWLRKNRSFIKSKFPFLSKRLLPRLEKLSVSGFAVAVSEEFLLLSVITVTAVCFDYYNIWLAAFMAFFIHILIHLAQWIVVRRYIPAIITSFLVLPYCIYGFINICENYLFTLVEIVLWSVAGVVLMIVNLGIAHNLAERYDKKHKE